MSILNIVAEQTLQNDLNWCEIEGSNLHKAPEAEGEKNTIDLKKQQEQWQGRKR